MRPKKITSRIESIILKEKSKNPSLGCRRLSSVLNEKHGLDISKSLINRLLVAKGIKEKRGRKPVARLFRRKEIKSCGLFFLKGAEFDLCLDKVFTESFYVGFPRMKKDRVSGLVKFFLYAPFFPPLMTLIL